MIALILAIACATETTQSADTAVSGPILATTSGACAEDPAPDGDVVAITVCGSPDGIEVCRGATWMPQDDGTIHISECSQWGDSAVWSMIEVL